MATMLLADQGADVIKIEPPAGDLMRHYGVMRKVMSSSFLSNNHGKHSLTVDIKMPDGLEIVLKLAATEDVLVEKEHADTGNVSRGRRCSCPCRVRRRVPRGGAYGISR